MPTSELISTDPCTGEALWRGAPGDVDPAVEAARAAARDWARSPQDYRITLVKAFQDVVLSRAEEFAVLISRETGKPLWEARTEVASVAAKVDISIQAQAERAGVRETTTAELRQAVRHKPHGVLAVLGLSGAYYAADYCAWPVAGLEADWPSAAPLTGLRAEAAR